MAFLSKEHMDVHCWDERMHPDLKCTLTAQHIHTGIQICTCIGTLTPSMQPAPLNSKVCKS